MTGEHAPLASRFWAKVLQGTSDECWDWMGALNNRGYGRIGIGGAHAGGAYAHRLSWELHHGPVPADMDVLHRCDRPCCVNPAHLFLGSAKDNAADMVRKGRSSAKLALPQVREIRRRFADGETRRSLAPEFGVHHGTIADIVAGRTWRFE